MDRKAPAQRGADDPQQRSPGRMRTTGKAGSDSGGKNEAGTTATTPVERLLALDATHPYRAVADRAYQPRGVDHETWKTATPLACEILAADVERPSYNPEYDNTRRSLLAGYLSWLATDDDALLTVELALSDDEILRYLATAANQRRTSHRSW